MELVRYEFPWKPLVVAPLGDIQWNGDPHEIAFDHLRRHIDTAMEKGAWFLGMGDYIDFMSPSNRTRLVGADLYDGPVKAIDDKAMDLTTTLYERLLKPTKGRWLGLLEGHHFAQLQAGDTTDMRLCQMLGAPFLGTSAYVCLSLQVQPRPSPQSGGSACAVYLWCHHGQGAGRAHAPILKLENLTPYWDADVFLMGHQTKMATAPIDRCYPVFKGRNAGRLKHRKIYLVGTGGWSKGYIEGAKHGQVPRGGYVERKMLNPVSLGAPFIYITPKHSHQVNRKRVTMPDGARVDVHPIESHMEVNITVEV